MAINDQKNTGTPSGRESAKSVNGDDKSIENQDLDLSFMGSREETADSRTIASRKRLREKMGTEIEEFLARGGKIDQIEPNVTSDPPKRPVSHYGQRPI